MAELENQRTLLEIDLDVDSLNQDAAAAQRQVKLLADQIKALREAEGDHNAEIIQLTGQMRSYQQVVTQAINVNRQLTTAQRTNTGSIDEMRANLSVVTRQYNSLSAAERENADVGGRLLQTQAQLSAQLKKLEQEGGNTTRNVGNYKENIEQALQGMIPFGAQLSQAALLFNSLGAATAAQTAADEALVATNLEVTATAEALVAVEAQLVAAQEAVAVAEAQVIALQETNTATAAELTAAQEAAALAAAELAAAQTAQAGAAGAAAAAQEGAAVATTGAAAGFKLFDLVLKSSIIGAIVGIILLLINYLKTFDPLVDKIEQGFAAFNAVLNVVIGALKNAILAFSNIGNVIKGLADFFQHPIESLKNFGNAMVQAAKDAASLKEAEQDLADAMKVSEVATAAASQKVAELILRARNASLSTTERKKLLAEAAKIDQDDYDRRTALANKELDNAVENARIQGQLDAKQLDDLKKIGLAKLIEYQNDSDLRGKITDEDIDKLKKAELDRIAIQDESTKRQEKIQNRIDQQNEKEQQAAEKAAAKKKEQDAKDQKAADELSQSVLRQDALSKSARQQELDAINVDFQKKINAARGYNDLIVQLEKERDARLKKQRNDFAIEDAKQQNTNNQTSAQSKVNALKREQELIQSGTSEFNEQQQGALLANLDAQRQIQIKANADNFAFQSSQKDLTEQQFAALDLAYKEQQVQTDADFENQRTAINKDFSDRRIAQAQTERDNTAVFEKAKRDAVSDTLGVISSVFGKQSALGKAAFIIQKALATAEVFIQTQKQVAAIELAAAYQTASAALTIPFPFSIAAIAGIQAVAAAKVVLAEVQGAIGIAQIIAQSVSGFAMGGVYTSDGRGGVLPGYSKQDNINAHLRSGEGIIVSEAMQNPSARAAVSAINVAHGGRPFGGAMGNAFATGGVFGIGFATNDNLSTERYIEQVAIKVAASIPRQILVLEDVNAGLNDRAYIDNKQNI